MPYISTEALVGAGLLVVLAFGYQYLQPTSTVSSSSSSKNKKKNKKKTKAAVEPVETPNQITGDVGKSHRSKGSEPAIQSVQKEETPFKSLSEDKPTKRKTLAEKIAPQPRKTKVDDMLAPEDLPAKHARVMRIVDPSAPTASKQPSAPVVVPAPSSTTSSEPEGKVEKFADDYTSSEEEEKPQRPKKDDGWNVVASKPKKPITLSLSASAAAAPSSSPLPVSTKIQRKNAKKAEAKKAAREAEEADRQRRLAMHRRDLERERINEIYSSTKKKSAGGSKGFSGATVDTNGKLIWD